MIRITKNREMIAFVKAIIVCSIMILFTINKAYSQSEFRSGYIITLDNDTIYGDVAYRSDIKNYKSCQFKIDENITTYSPQQLRAYGFLNDKFFTSTVINDFFVEVLVQGRLSLYKHNNYFLIEKNKKHYKIENKTIKVEKPGTVEKIREDNRWRGIISILISDYFSNPNEIIKNLTYGEKSLTKLVIRYNKVKASDFTVFKISKAWTKVDLGLSIGITKSTIKIENQTQPYLFLDNSYSTFNPLIGFVVAVSSPRISEKIAFQSEIYFSKSSYSRLVEINNTYSTEFHDTYFDFTTITIPISIKYSTPEKDFSFFAQAGVFYNLNLNSSTRHLSERVTNNIVDTQSETAAFTIKDRQLSYWGGIGILKSYAKCKVSVGLRYFQLSNINETNGFNANNNRITLNIIIYKK